MFEERDSDPIEPYLITLAGALDRFVSSPKKNQRSMLQPWPLCQAVEVCDRPLRVASEWGSIIAACIL